MAECFMSNVTDIWTTPTKDVLVQNQAESFILKQTLELVSNLRPLCLTFLSEEVQVWTGDLGV